MYLPENKTLESFSNFDLNSQRIIIDLKCYYNNLIITKETLYSHQYSDCFRNDASANIFQR